MRMKKFLLLIAAVMTAGVSMAQKVTLDFTNAAEEWGMPLKANGVGEEEQSFTNGIYTIKMNAGGSGNLAYYNADGYLMIGKQGAALTLPTLDFDVEKIVVTGKAGASTSTLMNVFVGDAAVSTETKGSATANTYAIAEESQAAGTVYTLKVNSKHNAQITKIEFFEKGGEVVDPEPQPEPVEATVAEALAAASNTLVTVKGQAVAMTTGGAVIADETGFIYYYGKPEFNLGDAVTVTGPVTAYGGFNQFSAQNEGTTIVAGENSEVTYPEAVVMDGAAMDAWFANPVHQYVTVSGQLNISGNYYNLNVEGATKAVGSLVYPTEEITAAVANGDDVTITGYAVYTSGGKYVNIVVTNVTVNTQAELKDPSNTIETAYTVAEARNLIDKADEYDLSKEVYVKGIITEIKSLDVSKWERAQYFIADEAGAENTLLVYNGYYLNGEPFTNNDAIKAGDEVIVLGSLTLYGTTYEMNQNNKIVSLNGVTNGINSINAAKGESKAYDLTGRVAAKNRKGIVIVNGKKVVR